MYKIIIADDERIIRQGLKSMIDWGEMGFEVTEFFSDGQEVIEYLKYMTPDVILTDIKMNHISGIEIAKYVYENQLPCIVILISGYQEFQLAIKGIKYGAEEYLLKPIDVNVLSEIFNKVKKKLDVAKKEEQRIRKEKERMEELHSIMEARFFSDIVMGVVDSKEYIRTNIGYLYPDINIENAKCFIADLFIQEYENFINNIWAYGHDQFEFNINNFLRFYQNDYRFHLVYKSDDLIEIIGICCIENSNESDESKSLQKLVIELEQQFSLSLKVEIRNTFNNIYDIINIRKDIKEESLAQETNVRRIHEQKKLIISNIATGNIITAQNIFRNVLSELKSVSSGTRNNIIIDILSTMKGVIQDTNDTLGNTLYSIMDYSLIIKMSSIDEIKTFCDRIFDCIKTTEDNKEYYDTNSIIKKAKKYIQENLYSDISQEDTANQLYICSSYLSRLFKKQTGENFTQYVTRVKMEKAAELLADSQYKTYQIGEILGYKSSRYFSRLFRAQFGMNPSDYRKGVLHLGGGFDADQNEDK